MNIGRLRMFPSGLSTPQVQAVVQQQTTSMRLYTQMTVQAGDTLTASTTNEQAFASGYTIPADTLVVGQSLIIKGAGVYSTSAVLPPTQRARLRVQGQTMVDASAQSVIIALTACRYTFDIQLMVRSIGAAGTIEAYGTLIYATSLATAVTVLGGPSGTFGEAGNPVTVDTTQPLPVALSCQFGGVASNNSNSLRQLSISTLKPVAA